MSGLKAKLKKRTGSSEQAPGDNDAATEVFGGQEGRGEEERGRDSAENKKNSSRSKPKKQESPKESGSSQKEPEIVFSTLSAKQDSERSVGGEQAAKDERRSTFSKSSSSVGGQSEDHLEKKAVEHVEPVVQKQSVPPKEMLASSAKSESTGSESTDVLQKTTEVSRTQPVPTPQSPKKIPTLPLSMREGFASDSKLGPVAERQIPAAPKRTHSPVEQSQGRPFRSRNERFGSDGESTARYSSERGSYERTSQERVPQERAPYERAPYDRTRSSPGGERPYQGRSTSPRSDAPAHHERPSYDRPSYDRSSSERPHERPGSDRPSSDRPRPFREGAERREYGRPREDGYRGTARKEDTRPGAAPFTPRSSQGGFSETGSRPFEPFRDRARGVQPFTTQARPQRPHPDTRFTADRGPNERSTGATRPPRGEAFREGGRYEGPRHEGGRPEGARPAFNRTGARGEERSAGPRPYGRPGPSTGGFGRGEARVDFRSSPIPAKESGKELVREFGPVRHRPEKSLADGDEGKRTKGVKAKDAKDSKLIKRPEDKDDARIRHGWVTSDEEGEAWRKKRSFKGAKQQLDISEPVRPQSITVRLPVSLKDLADKMKLKASQLISKLFLQGMILTLNDVLDDETTVQLLGEEFGCSIVIDTKEQEKMQVTDKTLAQEIDATDPSLLAFRPPIVAFMGHVDHGKTSLIDSIRKSDRAQFEVGAITQHIGAFQCATSHGPITILDTPGHEAFSQMRERGAEITDIVVLVIAGDEGMKEQTIEALRQARQSKSTIVVALNKCDKPAFDQEKVFRQLAENELLPEAWGGQTVTVNCSALTGEGIQELLEMLALQAEVLELKANINARARGRVIESQMQKGLGSVATLLVQNGTLRKGDCLVFDSEWAKVKTMRDETGTEFEEAGPSAAVLITGLSGLPSAGEEFLVVSSEKEAKEITALRREGRRTVAFQKKRMGVESQMQSGAQHKKALSLILRADVQGSLEAMKNALEKIKSDKVELNIFSAEVGEVSESDIQLAAASKATILGFHTQVESHAEQMIKQMGVVVRLHDIIYHAVDDVREIMRSLLDKLVQENDKGKAEVKALFKSSQTGMIAGCQVVDGSISRNCHVRVKRQGEQIWKGAISSLKRFKDDVREVQKGLECGIVLHGFSELQPGDILEAFEVTYIAQDL